MKKTLFAIFCLTFISLPTYAVIVDKFTCKLTVEDLKSGDIAEANSDFELARYPMNRSPSPDVRMSWSVGEKSVFLKNRDRRIDGKMLFTYSHAIKIDLNNLNIIEARQESCMKLNLNWCKLENGSDENCNSSTEVCSKFDGDPFDPNNSWPQVEFNENGPNFDLKQLPSKLEAIQMDSHGAPLGMARVSCLYKGTLW